MPGLPSWLSQAPASAPVSGSSPWTTNAYNKPHPRDPNAPDRRLDIASRCIYERQLPGGSYITAHVRRLQSGYYDSPVIHEDCINDTRFIALNFVFHEASTDRRFKSAKIRISVHDENRRPKGITPIPPQFNHPSNDDAVQEPPRRLPKFLRFAPHLLYGAMSPQTLDWNFNLAGSLGVSQTPVSASINPSGGLKSSYKVYKMMKIQGSLRTNSSWFGKNYDVEDGELVWTLEENYLQKSGLPREFTFVMLLEKGDPSNKIAFEIDVEPDVASWFGGSFPQWWVHLLKYQPLYKEPLDLDRDIGQKFEPCDGPLGFNFAQLMSTFDDFVTLPGTTYSARDVPFDTPQQATNLQGGDPSQQQAPAKSTSQSQQQIDNQGQGNANNTVHLRIHLDHSPKRSHSISATTYPYPETTVKSRRTPQPLPALEHSTQTDASLDSTTRPATRSSRLTRRVTVGGAPPSTVTSTPPRPKAHKPTPLETHYEEKECLSSPAPEATTQSDDDLDCEYSFPESLASHKPPTQKLPSRPSSHRHTKSSSTASPIPKPASLDAPSTANPPLTSNPPLRRTQSRSGLRSISRGSHPEPDADDAASISAAMDMLSGSPPPPSASPVPDSIPRRFQPINTERANKLDQPDMKLATPRTRAALADRIEIERAERERVERRNGNMNSDFNGHTQSNRQENLTTKPAFGSYTGPTPTPAPAPVPAPPAPAPIPTALRGYDDSSILARAKERERLREKRYSMPVTSTGIGYPSTSYGARPSHDDDMLAHLKTNPKMPAANQGGNGRSSLMIPVGNAAKAKRDGGLGIGVGVGVAGAGVGGRAGSFRRDGNSGVYSGYEYIE